ncbi:MAG: hypothetical protein Q8T09_13445 [Candidatus Melainabacteria bacterium]|nr:hypothetical protein [Candidatus Melainabacteria bacterium]
MNSDEQFELEAFPDEAGTAASFGTRIDRLDEPLILYPARKRTVDELHNRFRKIVLPMLLIFSIFFLFMHPAQWWMLFAISAMFALTYLHMRRLHLRAVLPIIAMKEEGVEIHSLHMDLFIPWCELKEARPFKLALCEPLLAIVPINFNKTIAPLGPIQKLTRWTEAVCCSIFELFGISGVPLYILESELPLSVDEVAEQMNLRRARALGLDQSIEPSR